MMEFAQQYSFSGSNSEQDLNKMERFLAHCFEEDLAVDGVLAKSAAEAQNLWKFRENCSLGLRHEGYVFKHDLSLPLANFYELTELVRERLEGTKTRRICTFGHLGEYILFEEIIRKLRAKKLREHD